MTMTKKKQLFVDYVVRNPDKPKYWAAREAGYSVNRAKETASELMKDPDIRAAIESKESGKLEQVRVSEPFVIKGLLREIEKCTEAGFGSGQATNAVKAYDLLGKHLGMWKGEGKTQQHKDGPPKIVITFVDGPGP